MKTQIIFAASFLSMLLFFSCKKNGSHSTINTEYDQNIQKGSASLQNQKLDSAFFYFNEASQAAYSDDAKVYALLQLAVIQQLVGDFSGSEETATQAFQNSTSKIYLPYIYNILGIAYLEQNNYLEAISYYDKVLNDSISELEKCIVQNNKAVVYLEQNDFKKAIEIEEKIIDNDSLKKDKKQLAKAIDNLGFAYLKTNNPLALQYLKEAETIRDSINNDFEKIASYIHLSQYYQTTNQPLAANYAQKAYQAASKINSPDDKIEALQYWITNARPEEAKSLALQQIKLSDSINKVRQSAKNQFAKIKYDASKTLQEKQKADRQFNIIFIILCMVAVLATAIILFIRQRNKKLLKLSIYNTETRIAKKIHDELANDVFQALTYAETQDLNNPEKKETFLENLDNIYLRTRNISNINSEIDTGINYQDNLFNMISSFNSNNANVIINSSEDLNFYKVKKETKIAIYRVLQELLVNMKKHTNSSLVVISLSIRNKSIEIKYSDNGQGFQKATFEKKGLQNVENRIYAIKGTITFDSQPNSGLKINMTLPR